MTRMLRTPASSAAAPARGRPREFDMDEVLDKAVRVFSERGYHATSIADLTAAMELASGSVYKAFKDKKSVFLAALDRYKTVRDARLHEAMAPATTGRDRLRAALTFYAESSYGATGRQGCLVAGSAAGSTALDSETARWVAAAMVRSETLFGELIRQGQADGSVPAQVDSEATARLMLCLIQGMRLVGKTGRTRKEMLAVVDIAMKTVA
jgi:TetR/AcrR family transcriptional regulator, transcriptional repressor for nem operon